ncbi:MAG: OmpA family protein [Candidatus Omnitrophica bacterium]|nr:OmpA family protein [Candidatus Omnitrophota bacterium]
MRSSVLLIVFCLIVSLAVSGCAVGFYKGRPSDKEKIEALKDELARLREAKSMLDGRLKEEIDSDKVSLTMDERGIVITFVAEVLFDSGKADLKSEGTVILQKIASVISREAADNEISIEGHTDNVPIKHSHWKSNWDLSTARATSVLHYLVSDCSLRPDNLSATGYGEYRPVKSNSTAEGRQANRRVEIIIKPVPSAKVSYGPVENVIDDSEEGSEYVK